MISCLLMLNSDSPEQIFSNHKSVPRDHCAALLKNISKGRWLIWVKLITDMKEDVHMNTNADTY